MAFLITIWQDWLYTPLLNLLIIFYNTSTNFNLGWAVVQLTVFIRILLLPFTIIVQQDRVINDDLRKEIGEAQSDLASDPVQRKIIVRQILRRRRVRPWAKATTIGVQLLVLVLLYQVFLGGINSGEKLNVLYSSVATPDFVNTIFYGIDIGTRGFILPLIVVVLLLLETTFALWMRRQYNDFNDLLYLILFPAFTFIALYYLASVKALFILTSMVFSIIVTAISTAIFKMVENNKTTEEKKK
ncbi:hypothetical protein CL622_05805, partial [archaeon]|nr:hypothetical protein [archaeon]